MITDRIYEWARSDPSKIAVIFNDQSLSYAAFYCAIEASRQLFSQQELPVGRTAIVLSKNVLVSFIFVSALRAVGANTIVIKTASQAADLDINDAACVVVSQSERVHHDLSCASLIGIKVVTVPTATLSNWQVDDFPVHQQSDSPPGGHIIYSSGTTGVYKKILFDGDLEDQRNSVRARTYSFDGRTTYHNLEFGMWTGLGFKNPSAVWHAGGCVVFDQRRDKFLRFFRYPITSASLVQPQLKQLIELSDKSRVPSDELELRITGGFCPLELAEAATRHLTKRVSLDFGSSELGSLLMYSFFTTKDDLYWLTPFDDQTIQIVDEDGNECGTDQEGELRVLPTAIDCKSYVDDEEASSKFFRNGFFYTGDMAVRRSDGRIRILGRSADVLNFQGNKIMVAPLEAVMQRELRVDEVCLFSRLDDQGKEELMVAIQSNRDLPQSQLDATVRNLPPFQRVRFSVLKEFPRTETGTRKTRRAALRQLVLTEKNRTE